MQNKNESQPVCNCCGRKINTNATQNKEDALIVEKTWGYFSKKDLEIHRFIVCEDCYDAWISTFRIPPEGKEQTEVL